MTKPSEELTRLSHPQLAKTVRRKMQDAQEDGQAQKKPTFDTQDIVDLRGERPQAPKPAMSDEQIRASVDMDKYVGMLMDGDDGIRPDEIKRVEERIANGDYGPEQIREMLDGLIDDLIDDV